ncbi:hypothetical protein ACQR1I_00065 [Bradyrhizobium sp. HKCCYLS2038]|uniref:hypothetical protein n=1 Tax=unclassified Bradyrhizobium TaxID=2631580 RepID=UPI003EBE0EF4
MSLDEFQSFRLFVIFSSLLLIHAIATSDSAPWPIAATARANRDANQKSLSMAEAFARRRRRWRDQ